ncbi:hypothetical protein TIFTF001_036589 [Ficus carica]|uniref:Uncharacterized protein n=1 Tax=Ficus carica TaxID=3494 RepID=A0AA88J7W3_FICCA|nr:hypothetical protein TIFTF001_036589 [Ficus carica]
MSDVTDSENEALSGSVDVTRDSDTGASSSTSSSSSSSTPVTPTSRRSEGAARLVEILQGGPGTRPDSRFIHELDGAAPELPVQANSTGVASERLLHVYRDPGIPCCPSEGLPDSRQGGPEGSGRERFAVPTTTRLYCPFRRVFSGRPPSTFAPVPQTSAHVAERGANAYHILVGCFILWAKNFAAELPFRAFQNLYRMKSAPSSAGSYYFQGFKGTFVTKSPDSDKHFKHLWFYAGGRWLHGHLAQNELPRSERVPVVFRNGYVWTRAPHIPETTRDMVAGLQNLAEQERDQRTLLD